MRFWCQAEFLAPEFTGFLQSHWQPACSRRQLTLTKTHEPLDFRACRDDCAQLKKPSETLPEVYTREVVFVVYFFLSRAAEQTVKALLQRRNERTNQVRREFL